MKAEFNIGDGAYYLHLAPENDAEMIQLLDLGTNAITNPPVGVDVDFYLTTSGKLDATICIGRRTSPSYRIQRKK